MEIRNTKIMSTYHNTYIVVGDTEKFGKDEILFEGVSIEECYKYLEENGIDIEHYKLKNKVLKMWKNAFYNGSDNAWKTYWNNMEILAKEYNYVSAEGLEDWAMSYDY